MPLIRSRDTNTWRWTNLPSSTTVITGTASSGLSFIDQTTYDGSNTFPRYTMEYINYPDSPWDVDIINKLHKQKLANNKYLKQIKKRTEMFIELIELHNGELVDTRAEVEKVSCGTKKGQYYIKGDTDIVVRGNTATRLVSWYKDDTDNMVYTHSPKNWIHKDELDELGYVKEHYTGKWYHYTGLGKVIICKDGEAVAIYIDFSLIPDQDRLNLITIGSNMYLNEQTLIDLDFHICEFCESYTNPSRGAICGCGIDATLSKLGYHSPKLRRIIKCNPEARFKVGFEVEKEDLKALNSQLALKTYKATKWCVERDGSLNDEKGYELISPVLDLMDDEELQRELSSVEHLINAKHTRACGGHIHISDTKRQPREILDDIVGYLPLIYALEPERSKGTYNPYGKAAKINDYKNGARSAINLGKGHTIEFRIFSSPRDVSHIWWRIKLLRYIMKRPCSNPEVALKILLNSRTNLHKLIKQEYDSEELFLAYIKKFIYFNDNIEGMKLDKNSILSQVEKSKSPITEELIR